MFGLKTSKESSSEPSSSSKQSSSKESSVKQASSKGSFVKQTSSKESPIKQSTSKKTSSVSSSVSNGQNNVISNKNTNRLPSPFLSDFDYMGRSITFERPTTVQQSNSLHKHLGFSSNTKDFHHSITPHYQEVYEEYAGEAVSSGEDVYDLNKQFDVIKIDNKHYREVYRVPTPPPQTKRVFHRLQSPKPKIIERIYVHRPPQEIIENILEVPPEKVRIIIKEKYLSKSKPIIRTKVVHLKPYQQQETIEQQEQSTVSAYPPQVNQLPIEYTQPIIPSNISYNSQQVSPIQILPPTCYNFQPSPLQMNYSQEYPQYFGFI